MPGDDDTAGDEAGGENALDWPGIGARAPPAGGGGGPGRRAAPSGGGDVLPGAEGTADGGGEPAANGAPGGELGGTAPVPERASGPPVACAE